MFAVYVKRMQTWRSVLHRWYSVAVGWNSEPWEDAGYRGQLPGM